MKIPLCFLCIPFLFISHFVFSQAIAPKKYWIQFTDKNNSPYSLNEPSKYLSNKCLERRSRFGIPIETNDFPLNPDYIQQIKATGVKILNTSRWFNAVTIKITDSTQIEKIKKLSFVKTLKIKPNQVRNDTYKNETASKFALKIVQTSYNKDKHDYGKSENQIALLDGKLLHNLGFEGQGMTIGIMDGGFYKAHRLPAFDSLWKNKQILGTRDFVDGDTSVFDVVNHGMKVLSCIGGNIPTKLVGTAPKAKFWLFRTEDGDSENIIEEANWVSAAEVADSLGIDVLTTSLGYNNYDDTSQSYKYNDMNGVTALMSVAGNIAARKGMLVINSAGNCGIDAWKYITVPADADSVLAIGATDKKGEYAYFSSQGTSSDGRIKPNVAAKGLYSTVQSEYGNIESGSGTSFSGPILAGMATCFWQAHPELTNMQVMRVLERSSNHAFCPDTLLGYGTPDFSKALLFPQNIENSELLSYLSNSFLPAKKSIVSEKKIRFTNSKTDLNQIVKVKDVLGKEYSASKELNSGCYTVEVEVQEVIFKGILIKF